MKSYSRFINEDIKRLEANDEIGELMTDSAVNDAQRMSDRLIQIRRTLRELLVGDDELENKWSRYFATAKRQGTFREKQVVMTAQQADFRILQLRSGLQDLLTLDDELDDEWLRRFGLTRWDRNTTTEDTEPVQTAAKRDVASAKRQELTARSRVLKAKQAELAQKQNKVMRDIAKVKG